MINLFEFSIFRIILKWTIIISQAVPDFNSCCREMPLTLKQEFPLDWQLSKECLSDRIHSVFKSSQLSDCTFKVGQDNVQIFEAHKLILASCSPVFEAMCYGPLAEKSCIRVLDIEPDVFKLLLEYMYTDVIKLTCIEETKGLLYASKKYMMPHLSHLCREHIADNTRPSNVLSIFEFAEAIQETDLYGPCLEVMCKYTEEVLRLSNTHHMTPFVLTSLLEQHSVNMKELTLFDAVLRWAVVECQEQGLPLTSANYRAILTDTSILSKIRFLTFTPEEFAEGPECSGILTPNEIDAVHFALDDLQRCGGSQSVSNEDSNANTNHWSKPRMEEMNQCNDRNNCDHFLHGDIYNSSLTKKSFSNVSVSKVFSRQGFSGITVPRSRIPIKQFYCSRQLFKTAVIASDQQTLLTKVQTSRTVTVTGMQYYTRLIPQVKFRHYPRDRLSHTYQENLEVCVLDQHHTILCKTVFRGTVEYNTLATVSLKEPVRFQSDREYSILLNLRYNGGTTYEYPLNFMSQSAKAMGVEFHFCDHVANDAGTFIKRLDMGFLGAIVFTL